MRHFVIGSLLVLPMGPAPSAMQEDKGKQSELATAIKEDQEALQGTWLLVRLELNGREDYPGPFKKKKSVWEGGKLVFEKDKVRWRDQKPDTYKLNPLKRPSEIDLVSDDGTFALGIYLIDRNTLYICWAGVNEKTRPTSFRTKPGQTSLRSLELKRAPQTPQDK
jgi:uncharacterized protein (TIGR03067 family)